MYCPSRLVLFQKTKYPNTIKKNHNNQRNTTTTTKQIRIDGNGNFNHSISEYGTGSSADFAMSMVLNKAVKKSKRDSTAMLRKIAKDIYPVRDMLCIQDDAFEKDSDDEDEDDDEYAMHQSTALDFDFLFGEDGDFLDSVSDNLIEPENTIDPDFESAFSASDMRCLALVSHNGMKKTMREFVTVNKNLLKKFRLTGTNSTMTMLKEVFADEPAGTVVFGPACASGPLGGDAELVAYMVSGKIGGIIFFQDPMDSHPHRADIDCLVRQALVHNVMMAETPTSALMIAQCLRMALIGKGKPELIPSFFFSLQSPTVEAYKNQQKRVVDKQKAEAAKYNKRASEIM
jgi:methylglyoxal synthase